MDIGSQQINKQSPLKRKLSRRRHSNLYHYINEKNSHEIQKQHDDLYQYYTMYKEQKILKGFEVICLTGQQKKHKKCGASKDKNSAATNHFNNINNSPSKPSHDTDLSNVQQKKQISPFTLSYTQKLKKQRKRIAQKINHRRQDDKNLLKEVYIVDSTPQTKNMKEINYQMTQSMRKIKNVQLQQYADEHQQINSVINENGSPQVSCSDLKQENRNKVCKITRIYSPQLTNRRRNNPNIQQYNKNKKYIRQMHTSSQHQKRSNIYQRKLNKNWQQQFNNCSNFYYIDRYNKKRLRLDCERKINKSAEINNLNNLRLNLQPWNIEQSTNRKDLFTSRFQQKAYDNLQFSIEDYHQVDNIGNSLQ